MTDEPIESDFPPHATLSALQQKTAYLLALGQSYRRVSANLGVGLASIHRWKQMPEFAEHLNALSAEIAHRFQATNLRATLKAIRTIHRICFDENQKASDRLAAATKIVDLSLSWYIVQPLEQARHKLEAANANGHEAPCK
jgi:hypothetical protein